MARARQHFVSQMHAGDTLAATRYQWASMCLLPVD